MHDTIALNYCLGEGHELGWTCSNPILQRGLRENSKNKKGDTTLEARFVRLIFLKNFGAGARCLPDKIVEKSGAVAGPVVLCGVMRYMNNTLANRALIDPSFTFFRPLFTT